MLTLPALGVEAQRPRHPHHVRFYEEDERLLEEVADFLDAALRAGGAAVVIATAEHRAALGRRLKGIGPRKGLAGWYPGELVMLDAEATLAQFMADGQPDAQRFTEAVGGLIAQASAGGQRQVHAFGEMVALLCEQGAYEAAIRLEQLWNGLAELQEFSLLCAYPMRLFADEAQGRSFHAVCCEHNEVRPVYLPPELTVPDALVTTQQQVAALKAELARRRQAEQTLKRREKELLDFLENAA